MVYLCKKVGGNPLHFQKIHNLNVNFLIIFLLSGSKKLAKIVLKITNITHFYPLN